MSSGTYLECIKPPKLLAAKVAGFCLQFISLFLLLVGHEGDIESQIKCQTK